MNIRIVNNRYGTNEVLFEKMNISLDELPKEKTTIFVQGKELYVMRVIKSYEYDDFNRSIWFIVEV
ncbi:hypothetical protein [Escherichia phage UPEC01]|uniref:Uncharacterized protein n=1 Tax=Escherichia phage vB_EcoM_VR20 TaxID=1567027 RepID=A0A0A7HD86_9CAUD|nr:hypothetical protein AVV68_gp190 [Escherichia phage vB_EcoM_VR20]QIN95635.1 hypothetical protein MN01_00257 [Escherichia phage MN01]QQG30961.1 hypothetical protein [Escherichia phage UPEC01]QUL77500.1 hypothetical protein [Escherichia phage UPEC07]QWQ55898.1 hypothetical protein [Escherichia phage P479]AIZ02301.1 hypothetical protein VR20_243 [Escherichia phage vB_EcoM_VR20]